MNLPSCNQCDSAGPLKPIRADMKGYVWAYCDVCSKTALVSPDGRILPSRFVQAHE